MLGADTLHSRRAISERVIALAVLAPGQVFRFRAYAELGGDRSSMPRARARAQPRDKGRQKRAEWRRVLPSEAFEITRHAETETASRAPTWNLHKDGISAAFVAQRRFSTRAPNSIREPVGRSFTRPDFPSKRPSKSRMQASECSHAGFLQAL